MRNLFLLAALGFGLVIPASAETLRVGMSGNYYPFTFVEKDKMQGFEVDFINAVVNETGDAVEVVKIDFSGLITAL